MPSRRLLCLLATTLAVVACAGIPLRSLPQLSRLGTTILDGDPADFALANQVDKRMLVSDDAAPVLLLKIVPSDAKASPVIERRLPLSLASTPPDNLPSSGAGRTWLLYSLTKDSQQDVSRLREAYRNAKSTKGVTVSVGIEQEGLAARNQALAATEWNTWLRTSRKEGFFELWSGTVSDLLKHSQR